MGIVVAWPALYPAGSEYLYANYYWLVCMDELHLFAATLKSESLAGSILASSAYNGGPRLPCVVHNAYLALPNVVN